ncbi:hypothetical protein IscW_ISCW008651, partial [Ixodes scapularis]
ADGPQPSSAMPTRSPLTSSVPPAPEQAEPSDVTPPRLHLQGPLAQNLLEYPHPPRKREKSN